MRSAGSHVTMRLTEIYSFLLDSIVHEPGWHETHFGSILHRRDTPPRHGS